MRKFHGVSAFITSLAFGLAVFGSAASVFAAGTANLYFQPASGTPKSGSSISVTVYENSGSDTINAVQANLSYSTSQLQYVSFSNSSAFSVEAEDPTGDTGSLHFARGVINGSGNQLSGAQSVVTVNFTLKAASGTAKINFDSGSAVVRSTDNGEETLTETGSTFTVATSTTTTKKTPTPSTSPKPTATEPSPVKYATTPVPSQSTTKSGSSSLAITNVNASSSSSSLNTVITWTTNVPATSIVSYGVDQSHLVTTSDGALVTQHSVTLNSDMMRAGGNYFYYVSSTDAAGDKVSSQLLPFVAAGGSGNSSGPNVSSIAKNAALGVGVAIIIIVLIVVLRLAYKKLSMQQELGRHFPDMPVMPQQQQMHNTIQPQSIHPQPQVPPSLSGPSVVKPGTTTGPTHEPPEIKKY